MYRQEQTWAVYRFLNLLFTSLRFNHIGKTFRQYYWTKTDRKKLMLITFSSKNQTDMTQRTQSARKYLLLRFSRMFEACRKRSSCVKAAKRLDIKQNIATNLLNCHKSTVTAIDMFSFQKKVFIFVLRNQLYDVKLARVMLEFRKSSLSLIL